MTQDSLSRRQWLASSFAAAAALALPTRSWGQVSVADPFAVPLVPLSPAPPINTARLLMLAKRELERNARSIWLRDKVGIVDFTLPSRHQRLFIVDMVAGKVKPFYVTHGKGSDPEHDGWLKLFSDSPGSLASSRGAYACGSYYEGKHGLSMRLNGLDPDNRSAIDRAIVVHGAAYADPAMIPSAGKLGRSEGCFALPETNLVEIIATIGAGRLLFADKL